MERSRWIWSGQIDCFGIPRQQRDGIIRYAIDEIHQQGGEIQIRKLPNRYDTDRYKIYCEIPGDTRPLKILLRNLAALMPEDHPMQEIEGYNQSQMQREDLVLQKNKVMRRSWEWQPRDEVLVR